MKLHLCPLAALMSLALASPASSAPSPMQGSGSCNYVEVWVDPVHGADPAPVPAGGHELQQYINNPILAFKTIQSAINYTGKYLRDTYNAQNNPDREAIVHLMPGIYGPITPQNGGVGNGEVFPIRMHDRVHLRGVNARRCVIRGMNPGDAGYASNLHPKVFWPEDKTCPEVGYKDKQVLIDCSVTTLVFRDSFTAPFVVLPWADDPLHRRTVEFIEGITFQGGDVQVYCGPYEELPIPSFFQVANCLFDMRNGIDVEEGPDLAGASIGLLVAQTWLDDVNPAVVVSGDGYLPHEVLSLGNTFLMAEFDKTQGSGAWSRCRPGAVGILDTCDTLCPEQADPIAIPRGVNRVAVQNSLFRTHTGLNETQVSEMAMVGLAADDTVLFDGTQFRDTNAYALARAGAASLAPADLTQSFVSPPYLTGTTPTGTLVQYPGLAVVNWPLYPASQASVPPQTAAVKIWDGDLASAGPQVDPAFVGEYLRTITPALPSYSDWRILPGSPLQDMGWLGDSSQFSNGATFTEPDCDALNVQLWDHEQFGNPREVDAAPDIGFDEVQLGVMAGSYANHSLSHNRSGVLNPFVQNEQDVRFIFLRRLAPNSGSPLQGRTLALRSNEIVTGTSFRAWTNPPGSLTSPTMVSGPPAGYETLYSSASNPVTWMGAYSATVPAPFSPWPNWQMAPQQPPISLTLVALPADDEGASFSSWVNIQPVVTATGFPALIGSMQPEFR